MTTVYTKSQICTLHQVFLHAQYTIHTLCKQQQRQYVQGRLNASSISREREGERGEREKESIFIIKHVCNTDIPLLSRCCRSSVVLPTATGLSVCVCWKDGDHWIWSRVSLSFSASPTHTQRASAAPTAVHTHTTLRVCV